MNKNTKNHKTLAVADDFLTPGEVARMKGVSRQAVYNCIRDGFLQSVRDRQGKLFVRRKIADAFEPRREGRPRKEKVS